jgi:hypothetical protein
MYENKTTLTVNCSIDSFFQYIHFLDPVDERNLSRSNTTGTGNTFTLK